MKKTLVLFIFTILAVVLFSNMSQNTYSSAQDECCQQFRLVDGNGQPVTNCVIHIQGTTLNCTPGLDGRCTICGLTAGNNYKAYTSCTTPIYGDVSFTACTSVEITIVVQ